MGELTGLEEASDAVREAEGWRAKGAVAFAVDGQDDGAGEAGG